MARDPFTAGVTDSLEPDVEGLINADRVEQEAESLFDFSGGVLDRDDVDVVRGGRYGKGVKKKSNLTDEKFSVFSNTLSESGSFEFNSAAGFWLADKSELDAPDPRQVTQSRDPDAVRQDRQRKARVTTDVGKYASDPDSYDYPFIDTPPEFKDEFTSETLTGERVRDESILDAAGRDDQFTY